MNKQRRKDEIPALKLAIETSENYMTFMTCVPIITVCTGERQKRG